MSNKANDNILTFEDAAKMVKAALVGTRYEDAPLKEYGGGDGAEDIKPFVFAEKENVLLGATCFPEGGMRFWVWEDDGEQREMESAAEAIAAFDEV